MCYLPYRQLRKEIRDENDNIIRYLPYRQLRNKTLRYLLSELCYLPYRQLRKPNSLASCL